MHTNALTLALIRYNSAGIGARTFSSETTSTVETGKFIHSFVFNSDNEAHKITQTDRQRDRQADKSI